jgi:hypothetical protein
LLWDGNRFVFGFTKKPITGGASQARAAKENKLNMTKNNTFMPDSKKKK